jgi:uncharacterized damage-inducible protein DinB
MRLWIASIALVLAVSAPLADAARKHETSVEAADRALQRASRAKRHAFLECLDEHDDSDYTALDRCAGELE